METKFSDNGEAISGKLLECKKQLRRMLLSWGSLASIFGIGYICMQQLAEQSIILCLRLFLVITLAHAIVIYRIIRREFALVRASKQYMINDPVTKLFETMKRVIVAENEYYHTLIDTHLLSLEGAASISEEKYIRLEDKMKR